MRFRRQDNAAPLKEPLFARDDPRQLRARRRHTDRAGKWIPPDANARNVGTLRVAVGNPPGEYRRLLEVIPQEAEARREPGEADRVRLHVDDADLEKISRLGTFDVDRSGQGVGDVE